MVTTKINPMMIGQRDTYRLMMLRVKTTTKAPMAGPKRVPTPPTMVMRTPSADLANSTVDGLTNPLYMA